jgi:hypothetical protein
LIVVLAYIALKYFNVIEGNRGRKGHLDQKVEEKAEMWIESQVAAFVGSLDTKYLPPIPITYKI